MKYTFMLIGVSVLWYLCARLRKENDREDYTDQRMLEVKKILREVIREKEWTKVLDVFKIFR